MLLAADAEARATERLRKQSQGQGKKTPKMDALLSVELDGQTNYISQKMKWRAFVFRKEYKLYGFEEWDC